MANTLELGNGKWATGKDTVLAFNDENNNFKPLPFSFSRASSGTIVNKAGLIETVGSGEPRIDFKDNTKGALLLEPQRTNLFTYSEEFSNTSVWGKVNTTFTDDKTTSPSGLLTGKLTRNVTTFSCIRDATISTTLGSTYVFSAFYKKDTETTINHSVLNENTGYVTFNFDTETISITRNDNGNTIETDGFGFEKYENGWYRVYLKFVRKAGSVQLQVARQDGGVIGQSTFIYGAQLEVGSYATSYIPTSGSAVTRVVESSSQTVPDGVIGQTEGTVFAEVNVSSIESVGNFSGFRIYDGTTSNVISFIIYPTGRIQSTARISGSLVVNINDNNYGLTSGVHKIAIAYKLNDYILYVDGSLVGTDTSATVPTTNKFDLSYTTGGSIKYNQTKLYNTRLSNAELQALTQ